jgi:hypothetical protein
MSIMTGLVRGAIKKSYTAYNTATTIMESIIICRFVSFGISTSDLKQLIPKQGQAKSSF